MAVSCDSARQLNDTGTEATALTCIGIALRNVRPFEEAISAHHDAATIFRETDDRHREGADERQDHLNFGDANGRQYVL
jgi:hypothetical protein